MEPTTIPRLAATCSPTNVDLAKTPTNRCGRNNAVFPASVAAEIEFVARRLKGVVSEATALTRQPMLLVRSTPRAPKKRMIHARRGRVLKKENP
jgi:hypothetical protein